MSERTTKCRHKWAVACSRIGPGNIVVEQTCRCERCGMLRHEKPANAGTAIADITAERDRQKSVEGWDAAHDEGHTRGEMALAAACYAIPESHLAARIFNHLWPWDRGWWKPKARRRDLVRAGALIVAEIERLDRANDEK